jgi:hypothetical protein
MKAIQFAAYGDLGVLEYVEVAAPHSTRRKLPIGSVKSFFGSAVAR